MLSLLAHEHQDTTAVNERQSDAVGQQQRHHSNQGNLDPICLVNRLNGSDMKSFVCQMQGCSGRYNRWCDFLRHYDGTHAVVKKEIWCPSNACRRKKAFPRKDKMKDHARKIHGFSFVSADESVVLDNTGMPADETV